MRKENDAGVPSSRMEASRRKEYYPPCRTIRETNGPVLFHCATLSEPFVSFNAPESDGPPRACQKVCNIPLFVLLFSRQRIYCPTVT
ncbi:hypothetical protein CEXT_33081 [Caerostris extrusa]|uniref:Uncharacterized protein n=1 Tax=Caerostris extrusa TaxID=172846 RepID=A0AAV4Q265_CAEEX|nr:hypothetical protein CEXT_33081 [Caerostris extrusa]